MEYILVYFTHLKCQKHIEDYVHDVGDVRYVFTTKKRSENDPPGTFYPPYYVRI
jgi:hypothetical protein